MKIRTIHLFILLLSLASSSSDAQVNIVTDRANNGQLKRMVYEDWDDWQPDPGTNWLGLPKDWEGFLYWRILHGAYYRGEDRRPFAPQGPFPKEYAALLLQEQADRQIRDSTEAAFKDELATHLQRSGGDLDIAWRIYFGERFSALESEMDKALRSLALKYPGRFLDWTNSRVYSSLSESRDILSDRIRQVHEGYMDLGIRMESYLPLLTEYERLRDRYLAWCQQQSLMASLPDLPQQETLRKQLITGKPPNDRTIVQDILRKF
jgi:hypothetical protein